ncbi:hypothetical protein Tco_0022187, partial [Tanacetum coccineum]
IPVLKQFKSDDSGIELAKELLMADSIGVKAGTLENLLIYRLEFEVSDDTAQAVVVMFDEMERILVKCLIGSIVGSEEQDEEETGLPSALANIVGTVHTLELKLNSYYEHMNYESFTCWSIVLEEALDESGSSGTLAAAGGPKTGVFVPLTTTPSITHLSKRLQVLI